MSAGEREAKVERMQDLGSRITRELRVPDVEGWSRVELTMPQLRTLVLLSDGQRRMGDIAAYLGSSLSATTAMVERLETKGLVERQHDPNDRRVVTCRLTDPGMQEVDRFWHIHHSRAELILDVLTEAEAEQVLAAFEVLSNALERRRSSLSSEEVAGRAS